MLLALLLCCGRGDPDPGQALSWNENGVARPSEPRGDAVAMLMRPRLDVDHPDRLRGGRRIARRTNSRSPRVVQLSV
jgi:hypothetical protein